MNEKNNIFLDENNKLPENPDLNESINDESDITVPDENDDKENVYPEESETNEKTSYPHTHKVGTVPALFTYYEGTELRKVLAVSNDCDKLINYANLLKEKIHEEYLEIQKLLKDYHDEEINSINYSTDLFLLFAKTYNIMGGITSDLLEEKINKLKNEGNKIALKEMSNSGNKTVYEIYYSTDLKTLKEVYDENQEKQPILKIEEILVL